MFFNILVSIIKKKLSWKFYTLCWKLSCNCINTICKLAKRRCSCSVVEPVLSCISPLKTWKTGTLVFRFHCSSWHKSGIFIQFHIKNADLQI